MCPEMSEILPVFYEGVKIAEVSEEKIMIGFPAYRGSGCYNAGRESHKMLRQSPYHTFCICEDCNWGF